MLKRTKHIFETAVDSIVDLLKSDNDQMRYRVQRVFQHPERDVKESNKISFINNATWNSVMQSLESPSHPSYVEELLHSTMKLTQGSQITEENWIEFTNVLSVTNTSQFKEQLYFTHNDVRTIRYILDEVCTSTNINDETYFENLESKVINEITVRVGDLSRYSYEEIDHIRSCNFCTSSDLNKAILDMLNNISINIIRMKNLIKWLIQKTTSFKGFDDTIFTLMMCENLLSLVSACVQKDDYLYRKLTNSQKF